MVKQSSCKSSSRYICHRSTRDQDPMRHYSKKRRRPWASSSSVAAATILVSFSFFGTLTVVEANTSVRQHGSRNLALNGAILLPEELLLQENGGSPISAVTTGPPDISSFTPSSAPLEMPTGRGSEITQVESMVKESFPVVFDVVLTVPKNERLNDLLRDALGAWENHLFAGFKQQEDDEFVIEGVDLVVKMLEPIHTSPLEIGTEDVKLKVVGHVRFALTNDSNFHLYTIRQIISKELDSLSKAKNMRDVLESSKGEDKHRVKQSSRATEEVGDEDGSGSSGGNPSKNGLAASSDEIERPSTVSIVFGFVLVALAAAGLVAYCYVFYRKRKKRLRRRQQMKESVQYKMPSTASPKRSVAPTPAQTAHLTSGKESDSSVGSSYKGMGSESEDGNGDDFARELQLAASLDQQAWDSFQRQKNSLAVKGSVIDQSDSLEQGYPTAHVRADTRYDSNSAGDAASGSRVKTQQDYSSSVTGTSRWAKSFPYGDEHEHPDESPTVLNPGFAADNFPLEEGVEWTAADVGLETGRRDWEPYRSRLREKPDPSSKEDERIHSKSGFDSNEPTSGRLQSVPRSSVATMQPSEKDLEMKGTASTEPDTASTSDIVLEVERLAKFVRRYEKKKERRLKREQERHNRSSESGTTRSVDFDEMSAEFMGLDSPTLATGSISRYKNIHSRGTPNNETNNAKTDSREDVGAADNVLDTSAAVWSNDVLSVSETETESDHSDTQRLEDLSQRLGITPFRVQKPDVPLSFQDGVSTGKQKVSKFGSGTSRSEGHVEKDSKPVSRKGVLNSRDENNGTEGIGLQSQNTLAGLRGNEAVLDNSRDLSSLRHKSAILDSSSSDVNVSLMAPSDAKAAASRESKAPRPQPKGQRGRGGRNAFQSIRSIFESKPQEAIFPPDQHWQYTY